MSAEREIVTVAEACEICRVSRRTIYMWLQAGKIESIRTAGGQRRIYVDTLFRPDISSDDEAVSP